jgi:hypothetical protein
MNAARLETAALPYHARYLELVAAIERRFPVAHWSSGDVGIWPLARLELHADMYWANLGKIRPAVRESRLPRVARATRPVRNLWKSRHDLTHWVAHPRPAHAIFLGDGVSLDRVDGAWQDRFGEPIFCALEQRGLSTFIMQSGSLARLPWQRPTFAANVLAIDGVQPPAGFATSAQLPAHEDVAGFLRHEGVAAPSLDPDRLAGLARSVAATATAFERVLRVVRPALAFVVTYYTGLGPAFLLACRRQGILSIDLQHCPQDGAHKAYGWSALPPDGYGTLPAMFWNWTAREAQDIQKWADALPLPWHRGLHGGHTQLARFMDDSDPLTRSWDAKFASVGGDARYEREILIALQPIGGHRKRWETLAQQIAAAPASWRWWIRRHPAAGAGQDEEYPHLLAFNRPNVLIDEAAALPLPALLRHMTAVVSLASGAAAEAAAFGIPSFFLSDEARVTFPGLVDRGLASVVDPASVNNMIARIEVRQPARTRLQMPAIDETLLALEETAAQYSRMCRTAAPR